MKHTKIVATLGPASESPEIISKLIDAGVDVFRFNLKHGTYEWHKEMLDKVRSISMQKGVTLGTIADLQGPEMRIGILPDNASSVVFTAGQQVVLAPAPISPKFFTIPFNYIDKITDLSKDEKIYIDDGKIELVVDRVGANYILTTVQENCEIGNRKSVNMPNATINVDCLTLKDKNDVKFALENKFDYLALSFVRDRDDIATLKKLVNKLNGNIKIISKIETIKAIHNFNEILEESDAIMFARGDLGIEIPMEKLPKLQKDLVGKCREKAKPVIVATQMMQSMITNSLPSRAEVADIANAIFDKTDAIMLSEESAVGKYPVRAVQMMARIANYNEDHTIVEVMEHKPESYQEVLINSSMKFLQEHPQNDGGIQGFIVFTETGKSARMISRFRTNLPVYAFSKHEETKRFLCLSYGVYGYTINLKQNPVQNIDKTISILKAENKIFDGDRLIVIFGNNVGVPEVNNNISLIKV